MLFANCNSDGLFQGVMGMRKVGAGKGVPQANGSHRRTIEPLRLQYRSAGKLERVRGIEPL